MRRVRIQKRKHRPTRQTLIAKSNNTRQKKAQ